MKLVPTKYKHTHKKKHTANESRTFTTYSNFYFSCTEYFFFLSRFCLVHIEYVSTQERNKK